MMARITFVCGHEAPRPFTGSTFCKVCAKQQEENWQRRNNAHRVPANKAARKNKKGK